MISSIAADASAWLRAWPAASLTMASRIKRRAPFGCSREYSRGFEMDDPLAVRLAEIRRLIGDWRRNEERAAATLAINVTTTPLDQREELLGRLVTLAGVSADRWDAPVVAPGRDIVAASPRDALHQLVDRERTYFSNVPVNTPVARLCRALVRLG